MGDDDDSVGAIAVCDDIDRKISSPRYKLSDLTATVAALEETQSPSRAISRLSGDEATSAVQQAAVQVQTVVGERTGRCAGALSRHAAQRPQCDFKSLRGPGSDLGIGTALAWQPDIETSAAKRLRATLEELSAAS